MSSEVRNADLSSLRINRNIHPESEGRSWGKIIGIALVLLLIGVGAWYVLSGNAGFMNKEEVGVAVASLSSPSQAHSILTSSGYVVASRKAAVSSKASGRLTALYVIEGDKVQEGQVIGRIESDEVEATLVQLNASLAMAKADVDNAQVDVDDAQRTLNRQTALHQKGAVPLADVDAAKAKYDRAVAQLASRKAAVDVASATIRTVRVQLENTIIRAPFNGTVLNKNANVGEVITSLGAAAGSRGAVVTIADMESLEVEADVSESNIERIVPDQPCEITLDAFPDKRYRAFVHKIIPTADRAKATVLIKVRFVEHDERVLPEMSAKVLFLKADAEQVADNAPPQLMVPVSSVVTRDGAKVVFRITGEKVEKVAVVTGGVSGSFVEITKGLSAGDRMVLKPSDNLRDGASVAVPQ